MRVQATLCAAAAAFASAAPASGQTPAGSLPAGDRVLAGPVAAGEGALVIAGHGRRYRAVVLLPDAAPRVVARGRIVAVTDDDDFSGEYASHAFRPIASTTRIGWVEAVTAGNARYQQGQTAYDLFTGPPAGPVTRLTGCRFDWGDPAPRALGAALDGDMLVLAGEGCPQGGPLLELRDLATGASRSLPLAEAPTGHVDAADGLVALGLRERRIVSVRSAASGETLFEAPANDAFALDGAGRVFTLIGAGCDARLSFASATEPATPVPGTFCTNGVTATGGRAVATVATEGGVHELRSVTPAGASARIAASDADGRGLLGADAAGGRVVFAVAGCVAAEVLVSDVATPGTSGPARECPAAIARSPVAVGGRRAALGLACPSGCLADVRVRGRRGRLVGRRRVAARGEPDVVRVRLRRNARIGARITVQARFRPRSDLAFGPVRFRRLPVTPGD